jgi:hypothetical protein
VGRTLMPARVMTVAGLARMSRASVPCTAKSAMITQLRGSSHLHTRPGQSMAAQHDMGNTAQHVAWRKGAGALAITTRLGRSSSPCMGQESTGAAWGNQINTTITQPPQNQPRKPPQNQPRPPYDHTSKSSTPRPCTRPAHDRSPCLEEFARDAALQHGWGGHDHAGAHVVKLGGRLEVGDVLEVEGVGHLRPRAGKVGGGAAASRYRTQQGLRCSHKSNELCN